MQWTIPGTVISADPEKAGEIRQIFAGLFLTGGITLSQVCAITGLEGYRVQNWVQRKFVSPPVDKKYSENQLCRILTIQLLKDTMSMEKIVQLLCYVNGALEVESDDLIEDSALYFLFAELAAQVTLGQGNPETSIPEAVSALPERVPGANEKIQTVLKIMLYAWSAAMLRSKADTLMQAL